ncbi:hypothetical protein F8M49_21090 [Rhodococcus zopfii]|uniref:Uncharacterized protein n=1 Tax=Rhodococcus zopfii TaxID=43772 RepID=A0ABU3WMB3_9NOCA|nr:hypothetical protein [Rhodococcus zopfii]MDV2477217.1 hypothetical protein [Rhodococcus zopfii]
MMPDPTTPEGRAELRALQDKATAGPWEGVPGFGRTAIYGHDHDPGEFVAQRVGIPDTKLIIAAVNALPALLDALDEAEAAIDSIREYAQFLRWMADDVRQLDAVYQARVYDDIATTLERKIGDRT